MKVYGVIMAGGGGTRFWPLSRKENPKQLLNLSGKNLMVNEAVDRLSKVTAHGDIFIVTNRSQADKMSKATAGRVLKDHILCEPTARNTAACIGYAAMEIIKKYDDGIMVITPSDAYIRNDEAFADCILKAIMAAEQSDSLVTVGITPTFPSTGYGYIHYEKSESELKKVLSFIEKPDYTTALGYLSDGEYLWNSGMFIWKASTILENYKKFLPDIYDCLVKIGDAMLTKKERQTIDGVYPQMRSISVDYGIMEKSDDILVVPGDFGWSDVGSWDMMKILHEPDENDNVLMGESVVINSKDCVVYSSDKLVACVDIEGLVVVQTPDSVMVCPKNKVQDVKKIVDKLKEDKKDKYL